MMMKCKDMQQLLGKYWDLPENDLRRIAVSEHIRKCPLCANEYKVWEESAQLITDVSLDISELPTDTSISSAVMNRIYAEESWRRPVTERLYTLTKRARVRLSACIAIFLAIFVASLVYAALEQPEEQNVYAFRPGVVPVMSVEEQRGMYDSVILQHEVPTASVTAPFMLDVGSMDSSPNYVVVLSILGIVVTLLIMNWLSRLRN